MLFVRLKQLTQYVFLVTPWHFMKQQCHGCHRDSSGWNLAQNIGLASDLDSDNSQRSLLSVGQHLPTIRYEGTHQNGSVCKCIFSSIFLLTNFTYKITLAIQIMIEQEVLFGMKILCLLNMIQHIRRLYEEVQEEGTDVQLVRDTGDSDEFFFRTTSRPFILTGVGIHGPYLPGLKSLRNLGVSIKLYNQYYQVCSLQMHKQQFYNGSCSIMTEK